MGLTSDDAGHPALLPEVRVGLVRLGLPGLASVVRRSLVRSARDRITTSAASLAFHWFLAIFPAAVALIGVAGLVGLSPAQLRSVVHGASVILPAQVSTLLDHALRSPAGHQANVAAAVIGALAALWAAIEAMAALQVGLDMAFEVGTDRGFVKRRLVALPMVAAVVVFGLPASVLLVLGDPIRSLLPSSIALARPEFDGAWAVLHWLAALVLIVLLVSTLYVWGVRRPHRRWEWVSPGSVVATAGWLVASAVFAFYLDHFGRESVTFGAFAGVAVLLLWLFLTATALLYGAELNRELERVGGWSGNGGPTHPVRSSIGGTAGTTQGLVDAGAGRQGQTWSGSGASDPGASGRADSDLPDSDPSDSDVADSDPSAPDLADSGVAAVHEPPSDEE